LTTLCGWTKPKPLSGVQTYSNAGAFGNLDFAAQAISKAETVGATVTAFVTSPATALALATIKIREAPGLFALPLRGWVH
jgi:hypothetical protein